MKQAQVEEVSQNVTLQKVFKTLLSNRKIKSEKVNICMDTYDVYIRITYIYYICTHTFTGLLLCEYCVDTHTYTHTVYVLHIIYTYNLCSVKIS